MSPNSSVRRAMRRAVALTILASAALSLFAAAPAAANSNFKTLYSFCGQPGCGDGSEPSGSLVSDSRGNLFGVTTAGGDSAQGVIFELVHKHSTYTFARLYSFCAKPNCADGAEPVAGLVIDTSGNLYGMTSRGGAYGAYGNIFELVKVRRRKWKLETLHDFCPASNCTHDGQQPVWNLTYQGAEAGEAYDGVSPLFGTAPGGGIQNQGVAFKLLSTRHHKKRKLVVIHEFCSLDNCADGSSPQGGLVMDASGNLYGTTASGGSAQAGVAYQLTPLREGFAQTILYNFCSVGADCDDGKDPTGDLAIDAGGRLLGTSQAGGGPANGGTVFQIVPDGANSTETVLYSFCSVANCADGATPSAGVIIDGRGDLFGTTMSGAIHGTVFVVDGKDGSVRLLLAGELRGRLSAACWPDLRFCGRVVGHHIQRRGPCGRGYSVPADSLTRLPGYEHDTPRRGPSLTEKNAIRPPPRDGRNPIRIARAPAPVRHRRRR